MVAAARHTKAEARHHRRVQRRSAELRHAWTMHLGRAALAVATAVAAAATVATAAATVAAAAAFATAAMFVDAASAAVASATETPPHKRLAIRSCTAVTRVRRRRRR